MSNKRPGRTATCQRCLDAIAVGRRGPLPKFCPRCRRHEQNRRAAQARRERPGETAWLDAQRRRLVDASSHIKFALLRMEADREAQGLDGESLIMESQRLALEIVQGELGLIAKRCSEIDRRAQHLSDRARRRDVGVSSPAQ